MPRVTVLARTPAKRRYAKRTNTLQRTGEATNNTGSMAPFQRCGLSGTAALARADILVLHNTAGNKAVQCLLAGRPRPEEPIRPAQKTFRFLCLEGAPKNE